MLGLMGLSCPVRFTHVCHLILLWLSEDNWGIGGKGGKCSGGDDVRSAMNGRDGQTECGGSGGGGGGPGQDVGVRGG